MRSTETSAFPPAGHTLANARIRPPTLDDRDRETCHVGLVEEAKREAFLGCRALLQPVVGDLAQLTERVDRLGWFDDAKSAAVTLQPSNRFPVARAVAPVERKALEIDACLFTQLHERETKVRVAMQILASDLVEHRHTVEVVTALEELTDERGPSGTGADRIAERDPRASLHAVHQERRLSFVEHQRLVPKVDEEWQTCGLRRG